MFQMKNRWKNILVGCLTVFGILIPSLSCRAENVGSIQIEYHGRTQENEEVVFAVSYTHLTLPTNSLV